MLEGRLRIKDLPEAWREGMRADLGLDAARRPRRLPAGRALVRRRHRRHVPGLHHRQHPGGAVLCGGGRGASRHPARDRERTILDAARTGSPTTSIATAASTRRTRSSSRRPDRRCGWSRISRICAGSTVSFMRCRPNPGSSWASAAAVRRIRIEHRSARPQVRTRWYPTSSIAGAGRSSRSPRIVRIHSRFGLFRRMIGVAKQGNVSQVWHASPRSAAGYRAAKRIPMRMPEFHTGTAVDIAHAVMTCPILHHVMPASSLRPPPFRVVGAAHRRPRCRGQSRPQPVSIDEQLARRMVLRRRILLRWIPAPA